MHEAPSAAELVAAVRAFITDTVALQLTGHAAFHARVAANALAIVERELATRKAAEAREAERLRALLPDAPIGADVAALNHALCEAIRCGGVTAATPGLLEHLRLSTIDQLAVDQPTYSGFLAATSADRKDPE